MKFCEILRQLRKQHGYTQKQLAHSLCYTCSVICNYERGLHNPSLDTLIRIADFYGVSTDYLLGRTEFPQCSGSGDPEQNPAVISRLQELFPLLSESEKLTLVSLVKLFEEPRKQ